MYLSIIAVGIGGGLGSLLRWVLGLRLNAIFPNLPLGTFASNVIAGYIIGVAVAFFARFPDISMEWRLFVITGLMGGLSTFSTFSAEVVAHLQQGRLRLGARGDRDPRMRVVGDDRARSSRRWSWLPEGRSAAQSGSRFAFERLRPLDPTHSRTIFSAFSTLDPRCLGSGFFF